MNDDETYFDPDTFAEKLEAMAAAAPSNPETPRYFYDEDCDSLELIFRNADYNALPLDGRLTVLVERETPPRPPQIVGVIVNRVREFIHEVVNELPGFQQEYQDGKISFAALAKAIQWKSKNDDVQEVLHKLSQAVGQMTIELGQLCDA